MQDEDLIYLRLDLAACDFQEIRKWAWRASEAGVCLTTLAMEVAADPLALENLFALAKVVHRSPTWSLTQYLERFDRWETVFIARCKGISVGYSYLTDPEPGAGMLFQRMTGVRPEYRRRGIATALKAKGILYASEHGYSTIRTSVRRDNLASLAMNRKLGFREDGNPGEFGRS